MTTPHGNNTDISKMSKKNMKKIKILVYQMEDSISEINVVVKAQRHMPDDENENNEMIIELMKDEINRIFGKICKLFDNPTKNKHAILYIFDLLKRNNFKYSPMKTKLYDTECIEEKSSHIQHFDRFVDGYYRFMNEVV